jgi:hypothetical protein
MRLIDADEVKETIRHRTKLAEWQKGIIWALIDTHKTVDAVPVIRCKDCKHWQCDDYESYCDELGIFSTDMNSYCSYAKRKEK